MGKGETKKSSIWHLFHCSSKDETPATQVFAKWTIAVSLLGLFLLFLGLLMIRKGILKENDISKLLATGEICAMTGGSLFVIGMFMFAVLSAYLFYRRKAREKNPLSQAFVQAGYPKVIELVDWGNITPTRTESEVDENENRVLPDMQEILEEMSDREKLRDPSDYVEILPAAEEQQNTLHKKKLQQQQRKQEILENKELSLYRQNIQDRYRTETLV